MSNLHEVAEKFIALKLPWPDHNQRHETSLMGALLYDNSCLRCWLEEVLSNVTVPR